MEQATEIEFLREIERLKGALWQAARLAGEGTEIHRICEEARMAAPGTEGVVVGREFLADVKQLLMVMMTTSGDRSLKNVIDGIDNLIHGRRPRG